MASRLSALFFDVPDGEESEAVAFWSQALGAEAESSSDPDDPYTGLIGGHAPLTVEVQRIGGPARIHVDLAAEDVEAEVARLERLGARRVRQVESWWVMSDPAGIVFCVVPEDH
ncbi:MAG: VOC family protein [Acidimicrobiia bacterium]|jgi:hypothetical protein